MEEFRMKTNTLERMDRRPGAVILIVLLSVMTGENQYNNIFNDTVTATVLS